MHTVPEVMTMLRKAEGVLDSVAVINIESESALREQRACYMTASTQSCVVRISSKSMYLTEIQVEGQDRRKGASVQPSKM